MMSSRFSGVYQYPTKYLGSHQWLSRLHRNTLKTHLRSCSTVNIVPNTQSTTNQPKNHTPSPRKHFPTEQIPAVKMVEKIFSSHQGYNSENSRKESSRESLQGKTLRQMLDSHINDNTNRLLVTPKIDPYDIFVNSEIRLSEIEIFGFDYDYTLAHYSEKVQFLIYKLALERLIEELKYPLELMSVCYDPKFSIRGIHFDTLQGLFLKIDYLGNIQTGTVYFGRQNLSKEEIFERYGGNRVLRKHEIDEYLKPMSDIFCLPEACLISDVIEYFRQKEISFDPLLIYQDVVRAVNDVHHNGSLHETIISDLPTYLNENQKLCELFVKLKDHGKKLFLLTNSPYSFANFGMEFLSNKHLPKGTKHWSQLFDVVMTDCKKPNFYGRGAPFRRLNKETGSHYWDKIVKFERGEIYVGGSLKEFMQMSEWKGAHVLYFGDHLFTDLMEPSLREGWRTGVIIKELETEVAIQNTEEYSSHLAQLLDVEDLIHKTQFYNGSEKDEVLRKLKDKRFELRLKLKEPFNKHFGSVFRTHTNATMFAYSVQRFADLYTSRIENLLNYPLDFSFYPSRNYLPHEFKLN